MEKIFADDTSGKGLISTIHEVLSSASLTDNSTHSKWEEKMNRHFLKENVTMTDRHIENVS